MSRTPVRRALLSVFDRQGLVDFAERLRAAGVELVGSDGTADALRAAGIATARLSELGIPPLLGGLVKTIHPSIAAAVLADRSDEAQMDELRSAGIEPIDLVVVDLYPLHSSGEGDPVSLIDIGGSTLLRAAAKNHAWVGAVSSPSQYPEVADEIADGGLTAPFRKKLASEAFFRTADFDAEVLRRLEATELLPARLVIPLRRFDVLRYGENPHQKAALYRRGSEAPWWAGARQHQGKQLSFNNYLDVEAAWTLAHSFEAPAGVVVKHTNPCGVAVASTAREAFTAAWDCDPQAAYGGVVALNRPFGVETAREVASRFVEAVIAPEVSPEAHKELARRSNLRLLTAEAPRLEEREFRAIRGGLLVQDGDRIEHGGWKSVSRRAPTFEEEQDLDLAWTVVAHCASNAVVLARSGAAIGIGVGDQSRVGAAERALRQAGDRASGAAAASDGFVPFRDTVDRLAEAGVTALVSPGGSVRDQEVIAAADEHDLALVFAERRHFRH